MSTPREPRGVDTGVSANMTDYPAGWTCEVVVVRLERFVLGELPRGDALALAEHFEACAACAELLALLRLTGIGARGAPITRAAGRERRGSRPGTPHRGGPTRRGGRHG